MKHTRFWLPAFYCFVVALSTGLPGCSEDLTAPEVVGELSQLTDRGRSPDISGSSVIWRDRDPSSGFRTFRIRNVATGEESVVASFNHERVHPASPPRIAGNRVAWAEVNTVTDSAQVVVLDLTTGERLTFPARPGSTFPVLSEEAVAWIDQTGDHPDVVAYEFSTGVLHRITEDPALQLHPDVGNGLVVWDDRRNRDSGPGGSELFLYDLNTQEERRLVSGSGPSISSDRIVYISQTGIRLFDLARQADRDLSARKRGQTLPDMDGDHVVWMETSPGTRDILLLDLRTGKTVQISTDVAGLAPPRISDNRVVWQPEGGGILLFTIEQ